MNFKSNLKSIGKTTFFSLLSIFSLLSVMLGSACQHKNPRTTSKNSNPYRPPLLAGWGHVLDDKYVSGNLPITLATPTVFEESVFVPFNGENKKVIEFDLYSGKILREYPHALGEVTTGVGVTKDAVYYGTILGRFFAYSRKTGELLYSLDVESGIDSTPIVHSGRLFFHTRGHKLFALDALTGKILWAYKRSVSFPTSSQGANPPLIQGDKLFTGTADGSVLCFRLSDGALLWEQKISQGIKGNNFIDVDLPFVLLEDNKNKWLVAAAYTGPLTILDQETGAIFLTTQITAVTSFLKTAENLLLIGTSLGEMFILDKNFQVVKKQKISSHSLLNMSAYKEGYLVGTSGGEIFYGTLSSSLFSEKQKILLGHSHSIISQQFLITPSRFLFLTSRGRLLSFF